MVIFSSNGSEIARTNIPIHLINKELFTTIILFNKDDTVDISALNLQIWSDYLCLLFFLSIRPELNLISLFIKWGISFTKDFNL